MHMNIRVKIRSHLPPSQHTPASKNKRLTFGFISSETAHSNSAILWPVRAITVRYGVCSNVKMWEREN
jgi:hypothetical protein